jgi:long-chain acyl-CoA synthetase
MNVSQVTMLHEFLERNVVNCPDKIALIVRDQRLTWADIGRQSAQLANKLQSVGVQRGDRVVIYMDNSAELAVSILGVLKADAVFSVVNPQTKGDKLQYLINDCRATTFIADRVTGRIWTKVLPNTPCVSNALVITGGKPVEDIAHVTVHDYTTSLEQSSDKDPATRNIPIDLAGLIYTSGSTGDPKGVMLTHLNMVSATESITTYVENVHEDVIINMLPMSFDYGLYQWLMVNQFGGTLVLESSFNYPSKVLNLIESEQVTGLPVVPTIASLLTQFADKGLKLPGIRYVTNTAAALAESHIKTLQKICPNARIYSMYGLTECKRVAYLPPEDIDCKSDSVGRPMPNMEVFVLDPHTGDEVPHGEIGELVIRGPHVMKGYWEKPEITNRWLKPGKLPGEMWLWSGDLFKQDDEGYLYFVSRKDDIIKSRGEKVSPKEVEKVLYSLEGVLDAAVVGEDDPIMGQAIRAYLVVTEGTQYKAIDIVRYCAKQLEPFMVPKYVTFLSEMQKTTSHKITKKNMKEFARPKYISGDPVDVVEQSPI